MRDILFNLNIKLNQDDNEDVDAICPRCKDEIKVAADNIESVFFDVTNLKIECSLKNPITHHCGKLNYVEIKSSFSGNESKTAKAAERSLRMNEPKKISPPTVPYKVDLPIVPYKADLWKTDLWRNVILPSVPYKMNPSSVSLLLWECGGSRMPRLLSLG
jgi:hypothetical protein